MWLEVLFKAPKAFAVWCIHTRRYCTAAFYVYFHPKRTNVRQPTTSSISHKKEPTLLHISWDTVESNCRHLHTNVTFYLSRDWERFQPLHRDALFPHCETNVWCTVKKWEETQCILYSFFFTRHWYAVICVSRLEYISFVSISLKDEAVCGVKRHSGCPS